MSDTEAPIVIAQRRLGAIAIVPMLVIWMVAGVIIPGGLIGGIFGGVLAASVVGWLWRTRARLEISRDAILIVRRLKSSSDRITRAHGALRLIGRPGGWPIPPGERRRGPLLGVEANQVRWSLRWFDVEEVERACAAKGWSLAAPPTHRLPGVSSPGRRPPCR